MPSEDWNNDDWNTEPGPAVKQKKKVDVGKIFSVIGGGLLGAASQLGEEPEPVEEPGWTTGGVLGLAALGLLGGVLLAKAVK